MAKFYQQVKTLMADVEKFLSQSIKDSKLSKAALAQKTSILEQMNELKNDYPQLQVQDDHPPATPAKVNKPEVSQPDPDDGEDLYEDTETAMAAVHSMEQEDLCKKEVAASDTSNMKCSGLLRARKDKKGNILMKLKKQSYCVLRGKLFYVYEKKTAKKQMECFSIEGYKTTSLMDDAKKDFAFEMECGEKKNYIFEAPSQDELQIWLENLGAVSANVPAPSANDDDDEVLYEDTEAFAAVLRADPVPASSDSPPPLPRGSREASGGGKPPPALPARSVPPVPEDNDDGEQIYEEGDLPVPELPSRPTESAADDSQDIYDETSPAGAEDLPPPPAELIDDSQDIYDETEAPPPAQPPMANKSSLFSASLQAQSQRLDGPAVKAASKFQSRPTPPTPPKEGAAQPTDTSTTEGAPPAEQDYENMYYGVWDCQAGHDKELSFKRGDIITVVDRNNYGDRGWWVGWLNNKMGLVPHNFLSPAYERV